MDIGMVTLPRVRSRDVQRTGIKSAPVQREGPSVRSTWQQAQLAAIKDPVICAGTRRDALVALTRDVGCGEHALEGLHNLLHLHSCHHADSGPSDIDACDYPVSRV